jgi:hypothetical protein
MLTGEGTVQARRRLASRGLATRAHFPDSPGDDPALLACADVVLIPPGDASTTALSACMSGRAVVAIESPGLHPHTPTILAGDLVPEHRGIAGVYRATANLLADPAERHAAASRQADRARIIGSIHRTAQVITRLAHQAWDGFGAGSMRSAFAA